MAPLDGSAVIIVVATHRAHQADTLDNLTPGVHVHILHFVKRHLRVRTGHSLAGTLVVRIPEIVLAGSGHSPIFLKALHHLHAQLCNQVGILSVDLFVAAPALVAPDVEDRSIDIGISQQTGLLPGDAAHLADELAVPGVPQPELGGEIGGLECLDAAYALVGEVHRNAQAGLFYKEALNRVQGLCVGGCRPDVRILLRMKDSPGVDV